MKDFASRFAGISRCVSRHAIWCGPIRVASNQRGA